LSKVIYGLKVKVKYDLIAVRKDLLLTAGHRKTPAHNRTHFPENSAQINRKHVQDFCNAFIDAENITTFTLYEYTTPPSPSYLMLSQGAEWP
jgi:hypothetical protein